MTNLYCMKDGEMKPCTIAEFAQSLRRHGGWAQERFLVMSDPSAHLGDMMVMAANLIDDLEANG